MIPLFRVTTTVPDFGGRKDVCINWFVDGRSRGTPVPYSETITDYKPGEDFARYPESAIDELFTREEADMLIEHLNRNHPVEQHHLRQADLPIAWNSMGYGACPAGGGPDFYELSKHPDWSLPFKVTGYFDLRQHERAADAEAI